MSSPSADGGGTPGDVMETSHQIQHLQSSLSSMGLGAHEAVVTEAAAPLIKHLLDTISKVCATEHLNRP